GLGQTTWKRSEVARGLESDECYYFKPEKLAAADAAKARRSKNVADYPNPDLSIEVDISPSRIDRPGIYAALVVAEVWRFDHEQGRIVIERLRDDSTYHPVEASRFSADRWTRPATFQGDSFARSRIISDQTTL